MQWEWRTPDYNVILTISYFSVNFQPSSQRLSCISIIFLNYFLKNNKCLFKKCQLENGTEAIRKWSPEYQDSQCPQQVFRNCIDIEIKPTENMPPYISNRFLYRDNMPTVFGCHPFNNVRNDKEINKPIEKTNRTDVNKFVGGGLMCFMSEEMFKKGPYYENKEKVFKDFCPKCRENCLYFFSNIKKENIKKIINAFK